MPPPTSSKPSLQYSTLSFRERISFLISRRKSSIAFRYDDSFSFAIPSQPNRTYTPRFSQLSQLMLRSAVVLQVYGNKRESNVVEMLTCRYKQR